MMPAARYGAAIEVLDAWLDGAPAEQALTRWARGARFAGSKDRAAIRDHVYDVLRRKGSCAAAGGGDTGRALIIGLLRLQGIAPDSVFSGEGYAPTPLTVEEAEHAPPTTDPTRDVPDWLLPLIEDRAGRETPALLSALSDRAPVWLRVAARNGSPRAAADALRDDGIETEPQPDHPSALRITEGARRFRNSDAYLSGRVELQDLSAQRAVARIDWPQTGRILDYCAGGGGKALAIADHTRAEVFAHDANPARTEDLAPRAARAGVKIEMLSTEGAIATAPFDTVLIDVPCSGSGTWRRDPDAKWRLTPDRLADLQALQDSILDAATRLTASDGALVYMTCSLFRAENEDRISAFLDRHPDWHCTDQWLDTPLTASDGFFTARLERR